MQEENIENQENQPKSTLTSAINEAKESADVEKDIDLSEKKASADVNGEEKDLEVPKANAEESIASEKAKSETTQKSKPENQKDIGQEEADVDHPGEEHFEDEVDLIEHIDISSLGKEELIAFAESLIDNPKVNVIKSHLNDAKEKFESILLEERKILLEKWIEGGGIEEDFKPAKDPDKNKFLNAYKKVNKLKHDIINKRTKEKDENLKLKKELLAGMKNIIQNENDIPKAFSEFHSIQDKWRNVGPVPNAQVKDLWMTYKLYVDKFYDLIKINKELQKLDQNKNLEIKANFCEQLEDLLTEKDMHRVLMRSRSVQNRWKTIGPVPRDKNEEIWTRFRNAIERINERKAKHEDELKERYAKNLEKKKELCEQAEVFSSFSTDNHSLWQAKIKEVVELQNKWTKAGPVAKEHNEPIWHRFRSACAEFFKHKNEFYHSRKQGQKETIQLKTELCIQAEALQTSEDWRQTSLEFKKLQEKWKESGRIPDKLSKELWNRFKKAGDIFFKRKSEHYAGFEKEQEANLKRKNELLEKIEKFEPGDDTKQSLEQIKQFQREWMDIGFIPMKAKDAVQKKFRAAIDNQFNALNIDDVQKEKIRFSQKVDSLKRSSDSSHKLKSEQFHISKKLGAIQSEVLQWENNIGFFSHSKNAQEMKKEFEIKIEKAKEEIALLKEKLNLLKQT